MFYAGLTRSQCPFISLQNQNIFATEHTEFAEKTILLRYVRFLPVERSGKHESFATLSVFSVPSVACFVFMQSLPTPHTHAHLFLGRVSSTDHPVSSVAIPKSAHTIRRDLPHLRPRAV